MRSPQAGFGIVHLKGHIDVYARDRLYKALEPLEGARIAIVDVSAVMYFDLTLINALLQLKNRMSARNGASSIQLVGATPFLRKVLDILGLSRMFDLPAEPLAF